MTSWAKPFNEIGIPPMKLRPRKSRKPHRCPKGWRWLTMGEWVEVGDYCCDPRIQSVRIEVRHAWKMVEGCHPVRRKLGGMISYSD